MNLSIWLCLAFFIGGFGVIPQITSGNLLPSTTLADGGCGRDVVRRMNEGYRAWGALKSVLCNRGLGIKAKERI